MILKREQVAAEDAWNVEELFQGLDQWQAGFDSVKGEETTPHWPEIAALRGTLDQGPSQMLQVLDTTMKIERKLTALYTYAHLRHDEDITHALHKEAHGHISSRYHAFLQETAWMIPELLTLPDATINEYLQSPELSEYKFFLEKLVRMKPHTLPTEQEELMAMAQKPLQSTQKAFSAMNDADFKFGEVLDASGRSHELTHGSYGVLLRDRDRVLRKNSFLRLHRQYHDYEQTLCELLNGQVQRHWFTARARNFSSSLEAALFPKNIPTTVYQSLIQAVRENIDALHEYMALRKKLLGVDTLHMYDLYVPLTKQLDITMDYPEAEQAVLDSVQPLGPTYQDALKKGLKTDRWVDRFENENKRSGAYSSGCFDSMPYILMNYKGVLRDVYTLAHEAGHSMHSLLSRTHQPYHYSDYPIFVAEVASTFNEDLLTRTLLDRVSSREEKIFLINEKIEDIRGTLFRQTMFAEFELLIHQWAEQDIPLTPGRLKEAYQKLNHQYFGPDVHIDESIQSEWSRIPHFYYNFYVYQYATGISAALALSERVSNGGPKEVEDYLTFLKGGCSRYPIDLLRDAGVDMTTPQPVEAAISKFRGLVAELRRLTVEEKAGAPSS